MASDSSGSDTVDFWGFGVVSTEWPLEMVCRIFQQSEKWRYLVVEAMQAWRHALGIDTKQRRGIALQIARGITDFTTVTPKDVGAFTEWHSISMGAGSRT